jgi:hypothetical protein
MEGAAEPGQAQPEDKQGKKMKEIQVEVDLATTAMKDTVLKIQERGQVLDHLQERSGEYFYFDCVRSLETEEILLMGQIVYRFRARVLERLLLRLGGGCFYRMPRYVVVC